MDPPQIVLADDPDLDGDVPMLRRVNPDPGVRQVDWDSVDGAGRPTIRSAAFQLASKGYAARFGYPSRTMSLFVETVVIDEYGSIVEWWDKTNPGSTWGVVRVSAGVFREEGEMLLMRDDLNGLMGHAVAWAGGSGSRAKAAQSPLANSAQWVIDPIRP